MQAMNGTGRFRGVGRVYDRTVKAARAVDKKPPRFGGGFWPVALFLAYVAVSLGIAILILQLSDIGKETTTTTERNEANAVPKTTVEEKQSTPLLVIFGALAAGGWLLIPLKFTWDELGKNSDARRHELEDKSDDRRQIAAKMRDIVFGSVTSHFGPMLYRLHTVAGWARRCLEADDLTRADYQVRLLYSIALLNDCYGQLRERGMPIILRSKNAEEMATAATTTLQEHLQDILGRVSDSDFQLMAAVHEGAPKGARYVSYPIFKQRVKGDEQKWSALRDVAASLCSACSDPAGLLELEDCASYAEQTLQDGLNEVYGEWYLDAENKTGESPSVKEAERKPATTVADTIKKGKK